MSESQASILAVRSQRSDAGKINLLVVLAILAITAIIAVVLLNKLGGSDNSSVVEALDRGDIEEALKGLERRLREDPADEEAHYYRGICHIEMRNFDAGLKDFVYLSSSKTYRDLAWNRLVTALLTGERIVAAKEEVDAATGWQTESSCAQEAIGEFHLARAADAIEQVVKRVAEAKGDRKGDQVRSSTTRLVYADSKIYARSMDNFQTTLVERFQYEEGEQLGTIIERGHRHLLAAVTAFNRALQLASRDGQIDTPFSNMQLAEIALVRNRDNEAEENWLAVIESKADDNELDILRKNKARFARSQARAFFARSRLKIRDYETALQMALDFPEVDGSRPREFEWIIATAYAGLGNEDKAMEIAQKWLRVSQKFTEPNLIVGRSLFNKGDYDNALPHLELAKSSSNTGEAADLYVQCLLKLQRFDRATAVLERRLESRGSDWEAFLLKVQAMEGMGWIDDARASLTKALGSTFNRPGSEANIAVRAFMDDFVTRHDLLPKDLHTAQVLSTEDPLNFDFGRRYLDLLLEAGAVEQAQRVADDLVARCPVDDRAHFEVMMSAGRAFETMSRHERAAHCFDLAEADRPWSAEAHIARANSELSQGNMGAAWRAIEKADLLDPKNVELLLVRFEAHRQRGETQAAIEEGDILIKKGLRRFDFLTEMSQILIEKRAFDQALKVLALVSDEQIILPDRAIEHALLILAAGGESDAKKRISDVIREERLGTGRVLEIARQLSAIKRPDLVVEFLEPRVSSDFEIDPNAVEVLARAYRITHQEEAFLSMLARLKRQGRRDLAYAWAAEFCREKLAGLETLSIAEAAVSEQELSLKVLELGVRQALELERLDLALIFAKEIRRLPRPDPIVQSQLKALILEAQGSFAEAVSELETAIDKTDPPMRGPLWIDLVELLGRKNQLGAMREATTTALTRQEAPAYIAVRAARYILAAGDAAAMVALEKAIQVAPNEPDSFLDRGLLLAGMGDFERALGSLKSAFDLRADPASSHAMAMLCAITNRKKELNEILRSRESWLSPMTEPMTSFVWNYKYGKTEDALKALDRMTSPTWAERQALAHLVRGVEGDAEKKAFLQQRLPIFMTLMTTYQTVKIAKLITGELESQLPEFEREAQLLKARALMVDAGTFGEGIRIVSKLLDRSSLKDEAALSIYAESYIKSKRFDALDKLVRLILEDGSRSDGFLMDLASMLSSVDRHDQAAKLLYLCKDRSAETLRAQARALFKSGVFDRAAAILAGLQKSDDRDFLYCQVVGEAISLDPARRREGYELLKEAVYRFPIEDPDVHVSLARAAYRLGERAEARKNIERFLNSSPASARNVVIAFSVLNELEQPDIETLAYLQDRRALLDPSAYFSLSE